jgi:hypothetical protein
MSLAAALAPQPQQKNLNLCAPIDPLSLSAPCTHAQADESSKQRRMSRGAGEEEEDLGFCLGGCTHLAYI